MPKKSSSSKASGSLSADSAARSDERVMDVAHPGKSAPSPTSRPVIVSRGPILRDPMVHASDSKDSDALDTTPSKKPGKGKIIEAPETLKIGGSDSSADTEPDEDASAVKVVVEEKPEESAEATEATESAKPTESVEPEKTKEDQPADTDSDGVVDSVAEQAAKKKKEDEATKAAAAQAAHVAGLVEQKTFFVPINVAKRQRSSRTLMISGIALLVALLIVGAAFMLDVV